MAAVYERITLDQVEKVLHVSKGWMQYQAGDEVVFHFYVPSDPRICVKVYSSVRVGTKKARPCGQDAIRVAGVRVNEINGGEMIGLCKARRINRVSGWEDRLKDRVIDTIKTCKHRMRGSR